MNKEVEEAIETLKEFIEINQAITCESSTNEDRINSLRCKAELTILNYIKDSTPNSVIRKKIEELDNKRKVYYENDEIYAKFFDFTRLEEKRTAKITRKDVEISNKNNQLYGAIEVLEEILKEGEK